MKIIEPKVIHDCHGVLEGCGVEKSVKYYEDVKLFYRNIDESIDDKEIMYEVYRYGDTSPKIGSLSWGLSVLYPVLADGECNMTRGHFHENLACQEFYYGMEGSGLLLLMDEEGTAWAEKVFPGSLHQISGNLAHRLINTGSTVMKVAACWSDEAGHDYARIESNPFPSRFFNRNGTILEEELV